MFGKEKNECCMKRNLGYDYYSQILIHMLPFKAHMSEQYHDGAYMSVVSQGQTCLKNGVVIVK